MVRRLLAAVFAVVVLFVAFQLRSDQETGGGFGGRGSGRADGTAGDNGYEVFEDDEVALLCIEDLREICESDLDLLGFAVEIEPAWTTVRRLRDGGELEADVWLTVHPFPELARPAAGAGGGTVPAEPAALASPTNVLARSPIVVAGSTEAIAGVATRCPETPTLFTCIAADVATTRVVIRDPATTAIGSLSAAAILQETGMDAAALTADPAAPGPLGVFARSARRSQAPLQDALRIGGSTIAIALEAEALAVAEEMGLSDPETELAPFGIRYPLDVRPVEMVAVPAPDFRRPRDLQTALLSSAAGYTFQRHGWAPEGREPYLLETPLFAGRPVVRTDLPWDPELVRAIQKVLAR